MKAKTLKRLVKFAPAAVLLMMPALASADIGLQPSNTTVQVGDTFELDVVITGLQLGAYDLFFQYNPLLVSIDLSQVTFDSHLGGPANSFSVAGGGLDTVELTEVSFLTDPAELAALQSGSSYVVAHVVAKALAAGTASFGFTTSGNVASDYNGADIAGISYVGSSVSIGSSTPTGPPTSAVPEPSTLLLLAPGVAVLLVRMRRPARPSRV